jgi:hypothetical protein
MFGGGGGVRVKFLCIGKGADEEGLYTLVQWYISGEIISLPWLLLLRYVLVIS